MNGSRRTRSSVGSLTRARSRKSGISPQSAMAEPVLKKRKCINSTVSGRNGAANKQTNQS